MKTHIYSGLLLLFFWGGAMLHASSETKEMHFGSTGMKYLLYTYQFERDGKYPNNWQEVIDVYEELNRSSEKYINRYGRGSYVFTQDLNLRVNSGNGFYDGKRILILELKSARIDNVTRYALVENDEYIVASVESEENKKVTINELVSLRLENKEIQIILEKAGVTEAQLEALCVKQNKPEQALTNTKAQTTSVQEDGVGVSQSNKTPSFTPSPAATVAKEARQRPEAQSPTLLWLWIGLALLLSAAGGALLFILRRQRATP